MITAEKHFDGLLDLVVASLGAKGLDLEKYLDLVSKLGIEQDDIWGYIHDKYEYEKSIKDVDLVGISYHYILDCVIDRTDGFVCAFLTECVEVYENYLDTSYILSEKLNDFCSRMHNEDPDIDEELIRKIITEWINTECNDNTINFLCNNIKELI